MQNVRREFLNSKKSDFIKISKEVFDILIQILKNKEEKKDINKNICFIFLKGDLGAGKTTFTKYFGKVLGIKENIISPTFILRKDYLFKIKLNELKENINCKLIHIDGYRFENDYESKALNLDFEISNSEKIIKIILIEWPEKFVEYLNIKADLIININHKSKNERDVFLDIMLK